MPSTYEAMGVTVVCCDNWGDGGVVSIQTPGGLSLVVPGFLV